MFMSLVLFLIALLPADDVRKPEALVNLEAARKEVRTLELEYWRCYDLGDGHATSGRPFLREVTIARDQSMRSVLRGFEGRYSLLYSNGDPASVTPLQELHRDGGVWTYRDWEGSAQYWGSKGHGPVQTDPRAFGLQDVDTSRARSLETGIWQIGAPNDVVRYSSSVEGSLHTVTGTIDTGRQVVWKINSEKGWNPEEVIWLHDGKVTERIVSELEQLDGVWFPREITYYDEDGVAFDWVRVERFEANRPEHPERLTLSDIDVDVGTSITNHTRHQRGSGPIVTTGADVSFWDGEKVISGEEFRVRRESGELRKGAKISAILEQMKQGTYRHPDQDLRDAYNLKRELARETVSEWEAYVQTFIRRYDLNADQQQKARAMLRRCQQTANSHVFRHRRELASKTLDPERKAALLTPVGDVFEKQLKPGLEKLPTRAQRRAAEEADKEGKPPQPAGQSAAGDGR